MIRIVRIASGPLHWISSLSLSSTREFQVLCWDWSALRWEASSTAEEWAGRTAALKRCPDMLWTLMKRKQTFTGLWHWNFAGVCCPSIGGLVTKSNLTLVTPWTVAHQAPLSKGFSRQEYWSGLPFPSPGDLPNRGVEPRSSALQADSLLTAQEGS